MWFGAEFSKWFTGQTTPRPPRVLTEEEVANGVTIPNFAIVEPEPFRFIFFKGKRNWECHIAVEDFVDNEPQLIPFGFMTLGDVIKNPIREKTPIVIYDVKFCLIPDAPKFNGNVTPVGGLSPLNQICKSLFHMIIRPGEEHECLTDVDDKSELAFCKKMIKAGK